MDGPEAEILTISFLERLPAFGPQDRPFLIFIEFFKLYTSEAIFKLTFSAWKKTKN